MTLLKQKVALQGVRFFAYHGYYEEEQKIGNEFLVDVETECDVAENLSDELGDTINYERLLEIAVTEMAVTRKLLETVAHAILKKIITEFPEVAMAKVSIRKSNLPVKTEVKNSLVELT
ncbi:MAG TPA: dihydroneopterin aldolase, partial [Chondromyces sp.]|nr:dihydroneopterin aldolase [Chondromyces sp.]